MRAKFYRLIIIVAAIVVVAISASGPLLRGLNLGLDLRGGVHVVLQAKETGERTVTAEDMAQLQEVMRQRVDELGVAEPVIQLSGNKRLVVELAGVKDPEEAVQAIGRTAMLTFKTHDGQTVLTGGDLRDARATLDPNTGKAEINLEFDANGTRKFADATAEMVRQFPEQNGQRDQRRTIAIYLDEELLTNPYVEEAIPNGRARITGAYTFNEAARTAALLRGGALPVGVEIIEKRTVGPTLGLDSLAKSQVAVIVGLLAIILFMLLYYRLPGFVAVTSLTLYGLIVLLIINALHATITLPGIAGLLLSVGMAVDANIIIYERFKEELRSGKTLRTAVDTGFRRALFTILDANVTTLIAAAVLYYFGTGPIRGFAVTLSIGIVVSMFTAITFTHFLLRDVVHVRYFRSLWLYGVREGSR